MPIIRRKLQAADVYPDDVRYNSTTGHVQSFISGSWVDNPAADPRLQTSFPPIATADPKCDGAKSVSDALKNTINGVVTAIDGAQTTFTIAGIILSLFEFGVFAIFIDIALFIANAMLTAGTAAITAALTDPVYDTLTCIFFCRMDSNGHLPPGGFALVQADVNEQIGGLGATVLNFMISLAGEGGINNLSSKGTSTGDCSGCSCEPCANQDTWTAPNPGITGHLTGNSGSDWVEWESDLYSGDGQWYITGSNTDNTTCCKIVLFEIMTEGGTFPGGHEVILCGSSTIRDDVAPDDGSELWVFQMRCNMSMVVRVHFSN
jgi:hypothetical protein